MHPGLDEPVGSLPFEESVTEEEYAIAVLKLKGLCCCGIAAREGDEEEREKYAGEVAHGPEARGTLRT
jgi:hypothetical protein